MGGSEGREEATGLGGVFVLQSLLKKLTSKKPSPSQRTAAVQGFGNVGYNVAKFLTEMNIRVVAVSDSKGGVYIPEGIDPAVMLENKKKNGQLSGGKILTNDELLTLDVDILVPSALENVITQENAGSIQAKIILEMANGPTTPEADEMLAAKGVQVIPDILSNSGGVTVSCFEWEQNRKGKHWTKEQVNTKLKKKMECASREVWEASSKYGVTLRTAAFIVALERLLRAA